MGSGSLRAQWGPVTPVQDWILSIGSFVRSGRGTVEIYWENTILWMLYSYRRFLSLVHLSGNFVVFVSKETHSTILTTWIVTQALWWCSVSPAEKHGLHECTKLSQSIYPFREPGRSSDVASSQSKEWWSHTDVKASVWSTRRWTCMI